MLGHLELLLVLAVTLGGATRAPRRKREAAVAAQGDRFTDLHVWRPGLGHLAQSSPDGQVLWAATALGLQAKMDMARLAATQQYAIEFDCGLNRVRVVGQLTAPQAERVGTEVTTWLAA